MRRTGMIAVLLLCLMLTACGGNDDYSNETAITYKEGSKELTDADPTHCWVDDNTFALNWFAEACGGELVEMPFSYTGDFILIPVRISIVGRRACMCRRSIHWFCF